MADDLILNLSKRIVIGRIIYVRRYSYITVSSLLKKAYDVMFNLYSLI